MLIAIHPQTPDKRKIKIVADCLRAGGTIIFPTDTVYGLGCDIFNKEAIEKICQQKKIDPEKHNLTMLCSSISQLTDYALQIDNQLFFTIKNIVPGPYTFILKAGKEIPKLFKNKKKTIGVRIPDNLIVQALIAELGNPLFSSSIHEDDEIVDYFVDPELIEEQKGHLVDYVIDGGSGGKIPSTIIDCTTLPVQIIREGLGKLEVFDIR
jgi:tRNA threonylcarbamoyl adenosine modification protein (Sua5/YciO/YrdC/YwlC family)